MCRCWLNTKVTSTTSVTVASRVFKKESETHFFTCRWTTHTKVGEVAKYRQRQSKQYLLLLYHVEELLEKIQRNLHLVFFFPHEERGHWKTGADCGKEVVRVHCTAVWEVGGWSERDSGETNISSKYGYESISFNQGLASHRNPQKVNWWMNYHEQQYPRNTGVSLAREKYCKLNLDWEGTDQ